VDVSDPLTAVAVSGVVVVSSGRESVKLVVDQLVLGTVRQCASETTTANTMAAIKNRVLYKTLPYRNREETNPFECSRHGNTARNAQLCFIFLNK